MSITQIIADLDTDGIVSMARSAEAAERYEDMCEVMKELVARKTDLSVEERNLLSVAYKNVVGAKRASVRTLASEHPTKLIEEYIKQLRAELVHTCMDINKTLRDNLIIPGEKNEAQVFYLKMMADYYRYLAECCPSDPDADPDSASAHQDYPKEAIDNYKAAFQIAKDKLPPTHPIRLGLALNYSVCMYEIKKEQDEACKLAKEAFDQAISQLDKLEETDYKDSTLIMQLLRDNLTLWTASTDQDDEN